MVGYRMHKIQAAALFFAFAARLLNAGVGDPSRPPYIRIYSVLRSSSSGKVLTEKFLSWHCIYFTTVGFIAEILLDLDHLGRIHQRDIVA